MNDEDDLNYINNGQKLFSKGGKKSKPKKSLKMEEIKTQPEIEQDNESGLNSERILKKVTINENKEDMKTYEPSLTNTLHDEKTKTKKRIRGLLNIDFVYNRKNYNTQIKKEETINDLKEKISEIIEKPVEDFEIFLKQDIIESSQYGEKVKDLIKKIRFPLFIIKKKTKELRIINEFYSKNYVNKLIIEGFDEIRELVEHVETFFKNCLAKKDYLYETIEDRKFIVGFRTPDLAFDFHRYLLILKIINSKYKNIKATLRIDNPPKPNKYRKINLIQMKKIKYKKKTYNTIPTNEYKEKIKKKYESNDEENNNEEKENNNEENENNDNENKEENENNNDENENNNDENEINNEENENNNEENDNNNINEDNQNNENEIENQNNNNDNVENETENQNNENENQENEIQNNENEIQNNENENQKNENENQENEIQNNETENQNNENEVDN